MKNSLTLTSAVLLSVAVSMPLQAKEEIKAYVFDSSGDVVKDGFGSCLRSASGFTDTPLAACGDTAGQMDHSAHSEHAAMPAMADADGDGVSDAKDQCPGTASGVSVNANGCEADSDGDGVADSSDACANTPPNTSVDARGCALDSDKDGVTDANDRCPGTAAGAQVNEFGCTARTDSDGDGIYDQQDACPGTAKGTAVDLRGCELKEDIRLDNVQFKTGTADLSSASRDILDRIAAVLIANKHLKFEVAGHTDDRGNYQYNVDLSKRRASSVRDYLVNKGVDADRLSAEGYGPDKPLVNNDSAAGRAQNRRVELVLQ